MRNGGKPGRRGRLWEEERRQAAAHGSQNTVMQYMKNGCAAPRLSLLFLSPRPAIPGKVGWDRLGPCGGCSCAAGSTRIKPGKAPKASKPSSATSVPGCVSARLLLALAGMGGKEGGMGAKKPWWIQWQWHMPDPIPSPWTSASYCMSCMEGEEEIISLSSPKPPDPTHPLLVSSSS